MIKIYFFLVVAHTTYPRYKHRHLTLNDCRNTYPLQKSTSPNKTSPNKTSPNKTSPNKTSPNKTSPNKR